MTWHCIDAQQKVCHSPYLTDFSLLKEKKTSEFSTLI